MIIDPHLHVWSDDEARYPFPGGRPPEGGASVELLNETMANAGVDKAVIVQPKHYGFDNRYIADCLKRFPGKFAAVGLVDPTAPTRPAAWRNWSCRTASAACGCILGATGRRPCLPDPTRIRSGERPRNWGPVS